MTNVNKDPFNLSVGKAKSVLKSHLESTISYWKIPFTLEEIIESPKVATLLDQNHHPLTETQKELIRRIRIQYGNALAAKKSHQRKCNRVRQLKLAVKN